jgi:hypothetical protein
MGNGAKKADGTQSTTGPAATVLKGMPMPAKTLTISNLFPDETVVFRFDGLTAAARRELSACFGQRGSSDSESSTWNGQWCKKGVHLQEG